MNALVFNKKGKAEDVLSLEEIPEPIRKENELTIKIIASPLNPADFMFIEKQYRVQPEFPQVAGFEGTGIIFENGGDSRYPLHSLVTFRHKNLWSEYVTIPKTKVTLLPDDFPVEKAAQLSLNSLTAWALLEQIDATPGSWVILSAGNSAVSKQVIQFARIKSIRTIALVRDISQKDELMQLGASFVTEVSEEVSEKIKIVTKDARIPGFLDAVGGQLCSRIIPVLSAQGKIILYGLFSAEQIHFHSSDIIFKNLCIKGFGIDAWIASKTESELNFAWQQIIREVAGEDFQLKVAATFKMEDFQKAIFESKNPVNGKVVFCMQ